MKKLLLSLSFMAITGFSFAQKGDSFWKTTSKKATATVVQNKTMISNPQLYELDILKLKQKLTNAPERNFKSVQSDLILSFPSSNGTFENFRIMEQSNMDPALAARYPEIKSYVGQGVENPTATIYFSISPLGFQAMTIYAEKAAEFIETYTTDQSIYTAYRKSDRKNAFTKFECGVIDEISNKISSDAALKNADDSTLRTFRLAVSTTGEYTAYFGGTKAQALAAINATMTRVNGVYEKDFAVRMVLIANTDAVIYTSASTDPYTTNYNSQVQSTLTSVIGEANYDVGHLFVAAANDGNAGCIGCVCTNNSKGSAFTAATPPTGDLFDIDFVAHELGHQFGANHTWSYADERSGFNMEPGSGSTIMGYAGITRQDVQPNSDAYFHSASIQQVTNNIKTKTCPTSTATGNAVPTASAGIDYTIPKSTPFMLTGSGTDANGDALTFCWEQFDNAASTATDASSAASATRTSGPTFRSYNPTTSPVRYFPRLSSVLAGATTTTGSEITVEALPSVARTMNFRLTVRDNRAGGSANKSDDMIVTVNGTAGPFSVTAPNTAVSYVGGSSQTITWNVSGTTTNGVNCANVDILISTNGGTTWSTLLAATPNDGTQAVTIPNTAGTANRILVKGTNHIFFDVSNTNFTITAGSTDTVPPTAPTLSASGTTQTTTSLSWSGATDNVTVTGYDVFQGATLLGSTAATTFAVSGLTASTTYSFIVRAKDAAGNSSVASNAVSVTTLAVVADTTPPTAPTALSASGTTTTSTNLAWTAATDNVAVTGYEVFSGRTLLTTVTGTTYTAAGLTAATAYTFSVRARDAAGNVSASSNVVNVTTLTVTLTYCTANSTNTNDEKIGRVAFGSIDKTSTGTAGYENFTALSTNVTRGTANTITITPTWTGTIYAEGYAVWIDYNQNGVFTDASELAYSRAATTTTPVSGSITIPATALLGSTRMRVSMRYNQIPSSSCGSFTYGQVEDYTVNITSSAVRTDLSSANFTINIYPNPVKGEVLNVTMEESNATYRVINLLGQEISNGKIDNGTISVSRVPAGSYLLEVTSNEQTVVKRFVKE